MATERRLAAESGKRRRTGPPRLVLGYADPACAALTWHHFGCRGWEVHSASTGRRARELTRVLAPALVVVDVDLPDESGFLTCRKLTFEFPRLLVILTGSCRTPVLARFAEFAGAYAFFDRDEDPRMLAALVPSSPADTALSIPTSLF